MVHGLTLANLPYPTESYNDGSKMTDVTIPSHNQSSYPMQHSVMVPLKKLMKIQTQCYDYDQFQKSREGEENDVMLTVTSVDGCSDTSSITSKSETSEIDVEMLEESPLESQARKLNSFSPPMIPNNCTLVRGSGPSPVNGINGQIPKQSGNISPHKNKGRSNSGELLLYI